MMSGGCCRLEVFFDDVLDIGVAAAAAGATRAGTGCGGCHSDIKDIIEKHFQAAAAA